MTASLPTNQKEDDIVGDLFEQQSSVEAAKSCGGQYDVHSLRAAGKMRWSFVSKEVVCVVLLTTIFR